MVGRGQLRHLGGREFPPLPDRQGPQLEGPERDSTEAPYDQAHDATEPLDLAVATFGQAQLDPVEPARGFAEAPGPVDPCGAILEENPALERLQYVRPQAALHKDVVDAADAVARMSEPVGEAPVVGEEQEPLGVEVEAPDRVEPHPEIRQEVEHPRAPPRILPRCEIPGRLVKEHVTLGLGTREQAPVDLDAVPRRIGVGPQLDDRHAIDADPPGDDQPLRRAP
jgi:hypothetical protein